MPGASSACPSLPKQLLRVVFRELAECVGASIIFFAMNVVIGVIGVFLVRGFWGFLVNNLSPSPHFFWNCAFQRSYEREFWICAF